MGRGRPTRIEAHPERVLTFNTQTQEIGTFVPQYQPIPDPDPEREPALEPKVSLPRTVERGSFLVSF
jgi:hypothetical protein